jgi:hypothetical protein
MIVAATHLPLPLPEAAELRLTTDAAELRLTTDAAELRLA